MLPALAARRLDPPPHHGASLSSLAPLPRTRVIMRPSLAARSARLLGLTLLVLCPAVISFSLTSRACAEPSFFWANPKPTGTELGGVEFESASVGYAVGLYSTVLRTTDGGITWHDLTVLDAAAPDFKDVLVAAPGTLLAVGAAPGIFRSTDSGASWAPVANPSTASLQNLFALDASTFFAAGNNGNLLRSTNAGVSWSLLSAPTSFGIVDQWWQDSLRGIVVGPFHVRRTTDGGATWAAIPGVSESNTFFLGDVQFLDETNGWILLDFETYRTTNGGASWSLLPGSLADAPIYAEEALLIDAQTRIVVTEAEGADIFKTTDDGTTWTLLLRHDGTRGVMDIERAPGGTIVATTTAGDLLRSTDEGVTWTNAADVAGPPERAAGSVMQVNAGLPGFAGGSDGLWIQTTDAGASWFDPVSTPGLSSVFAVRVRDASFVLAGGVGTTGQSDVRRSTDGGATWTIHPIAGSYVGYPQGLAAFDDGTCFAATYGGQNIGTVYRSTDSGQTWHVRNTGLSGQRIFDLFFLDSQTGFVCGGEFGNAMISRTTNSGAQWSPVAGTGLGSDAVRDMHWFDVNEGIVVGGSLVQRTTDGGTHWTTVSIGMGYGAIDFFDAVHGIVDAFPHDAGITTDGGVTWTRVPLPLAGFVSDVATLGERFYVLGDANSILGVDTNAPPVAVHEIAPGASDRALAMWPNPLRAGVSRTLFFRASEDPTGLAPWEARIYDLRGRMLAQQRVMMNAREGRVSLENVVLFPGVVFVQIRTENGAAVTRKLTVLR